jgi:hypothetical protein
VERLRGDSENKNAHEILCDRGVEGVWCGVVRMVVFGVTTERYGGQRCGDEVSESSGSEEGHGGDSYRQTGLA